MNASDSQMARSDQVVRGVRRAATAVIGAAVLSFVSAPASAGLPQTGPGCPLRFDQPTTGLPATCLFVGRFNTPGAADVMAAFAGDGTTFVIGMAGGDATPMLYLPATAVSPTAGDLLRWQDGVQPAAVADADAVSDLVVGSVTLEDGGRRLRIRAAARPGSDAAPAEFVGRFATMVEAGEEDAVVSQR